MKNLVCSSPESSNISGKFTQFSEECLFDDAACLDDMDYFVKTLSGIKAKGVRPELIGSIIAHYASIWLPDLANIDESSKGSLRRTPKSPDPSQGLNASLMKKRFFVETLIGILPPDKDSVPCSFLLRLLRSANMLGVENVYRAELEKRISWQLDQASLDDLMIPSFSHTCEVLLDVELVIRLVTRFVNLDETFKSGAALIKVGKLVDCYLAEVALDSRLKTPEFIALAGAIPPHGRSVDDGLYRAIDTYLKAHPGVGKHERKSLCRLIDSRKLSPDACLHAAQNERLPVRSVIQVLFSEQSKLNYQLDHSGSLSGARSSPSMIGFEHMHGRNQSKRIMTIEQMEIRRLKEDVLTLQGQCHTMQAQIEKLLHSEKKKSSFFGNWRKLGALKTTISSTNYVLGKEKDYLTENEINMGRRTPLVQDATYKRTGKMARGKSSSSKWRKSMS
ncbi:hypothetical protein DCAR_0518595 [Daucus carota subsp. sativus]|uniref:Uncharacterized protein n=1 Tax=Daucus carota subsp. sativus TaxID=79200 RepID=A0A164XCP9_DAUCS|nr:PREDICTED: root phototropism protein 3 [Daucus carota subsp. sativus]WOG99247.1 hypothetical protein DCAR_0518595 [Daucus carota subsp. sativus]